MKIVIIANERERLDNKKQQNKINDERIAAIKRNRTKLFPF